MLKGFEMRLTNVSRGLYYKGKQVTEAFPPELDHTALSCKSLIDPCYQVSISEIKLIQTLHHSSPPSP